MPLEPSIERNDAIDALCMEIAELVGMLTPHAPLATSPTLHRKLRIETIHSSLVIEGNRLDERAMTAILDGKRVLGDRRDILEVENARRAYDLIPGLDPYSVEDLLRAHRAMMDGLVPDAGRFRSGNVGVFDADVLIHAGTPAAYVPEVMADVFGWLRATRMHPLLASCVFHFEFEFCHPFSDGNGRVGRLWHTLLLSRWRPVLAWLPIESAIRRRQAGYYEALAESGASGSSGRFVEFMLEAVRESILPFARPPSKSDAARTRVLDFFRQNSRGTLTQLSEILGCSKRSAERIVAELKEEGLLIRQGSARSGVWIVRAGGSLTPRPRRSADATARADP
ncbi:cell filamentation protein Fic [Schaalia meyeri]|uniref:Fic family protein n=1 Tax=Schaalia meyeri TaxID=52773 RepID=UPI00067FC8A5|nr:Fic family protein [Schaalia meyeri]AKU65306.1 cell filamentation protein Fic [Schaalia meyeri]